jgi:DNA-binding LacI/PurR family transcriptional regulator
MAVRGQESDYDGGVAAARDLLAANERPDAIFCANDLLAFGVMDVIRRETTLRVPEDIAIIGFDDVPEAAWLSYELTTFRQDPVIMATRAVQLLEHRLQNPDAPRGYERVIPELVLRRSFPVA